MSVDSSRPAVPAATAGPAVTATPGLASEASNHASAVSASRRTLSRALSGAGAAFLLAALAAPALVDAERSVLAFPTVVHAVLVIVAARAARGVSSGLKLDTLTLFLAWELLRGCVAPLILMYVGPAESGPFFRLGTWDDGRFVLFAGSAFFVVVVAVRLSVAAAAGSLRPTRHERTGRARPAVVAADRVPASLLVVLGVAGLAIRFPSVASITGFLSGDVDALQSNDDVSASGLLLLSLFLRPLLVVGLVSIVRRRRRLGLSWWPLVPLIAVAVVLALASYGLNRATVAFPLVAFAVIFLERSERLLRLGPVVVTLGALAAFFAVVGSVRSDLWTERSGLEASPLSLVATLRALLSYAASPLQLGVVLPAVEHSSPFGVRSFGLSLLSPVPGAPDVARSESGTAIYNNIAYHSFVGKDQLLPSWFEGWLSFGAVGLVSVGVATGLLFTFADHLRRRLHTLLGLYGATILSVWSSQAGVTSIGVIEQNTINFVLTPLALALAAQLWPSSRPDPDHIDPDFVDPERKRPTP